jgi:hypothetical protein
MRSAWIALLCLAACRDGSPPNEQPARRPAEDAPRERVFTPSPATVRAVGPYSITAGGVGLYALGSDLRTVLAILPSKAPVDQLEIEGVVNYKVVPPDDERILVGFDPSGVAAFVAVVAPDIAMVEGGYAVGSSIDDVRAGLGPDVRDGAVRDPHLLVLSKLPNARVVTDESRVVAIVVTPDARRAEPPAASGANASACDRAREILAGSLPEPHTADDAARASYGCFTGNAPEAALAESDELVLYGGEPGRLRRATAVSMPGLLFAGALDVDHDGKSEIVTVAERRTGDALAARIVVWRGEGGRLTSVADKDVYRMTSGSAGWIGAKLKDVSFLIEVMPGSTASVEVGGLYLQRGEDLVHTVAPLLPETVAVRPRRPATPAAPPAAGGAPPAATPPPAKGQEGDKTPPAKDGASKADQAKKPPPPKRGAKRDASDM